MSGVIFISEGFEYIVMKIDLSQRVCIILKRHHKSGANVMTNSSPFNRTRSSSGVALGCINLGSLAVGSELKKITIFFALAVLFVTLSYDFEIVHQNCKAISISMSYMPKCQNDLKKIHWHHIHDIIGPSVLHCT